MKFGFASRISEKMHISNLMKIRPVGVQLIHADGQTHADRYDEGNSRFSQFFGRM